MMHASRPERVPGHYDVDPHYQITSRACLEIQQNLAVHGLLPPDATARDFRSIPALHCVLAAALA